VSFLIVTFSALAVFFIGNASSVLFCICSDILGCDILDCGILDCDILDCVILGVFGFFKQSGHLHVGGPLFFGSKTCN